jgi:starvation-inducible DNA-binding protein
MDKLAQELKVLLGNSFAFYLKAHGFHWNVEGVNFPQYHAFFEVIYSEVYDSLDTMAEHIRQLDHYVPAGLSKLASLATIGDANGVPSAKGMLEELLKDNEVLLKQIEVVYALAEKERRRGLSNFLADREAAHSKHRWQLTATLKNTGTH